jgi:hypothetical protein
MSLAITVGVVVIAVVLVVSAVGYLLNRLNQNS